MEMTSGGKVNFVSTISSCSAAKSRFSDALTKGLIEFSQIVRFFVKFEIKFQNRSMRGKICRNRPALCGFPAAIFAALPSGNVRYLCVKLPSMPAGPDLTFQFLEDATETLRAIAHPLRLLIIDMLFHADSLTVTEIYERLGVEQAVASHHLRILKDKNVVFVRREGKNSNYALSAPAYFELLELLRKTI